MLAQPILNPFLATTVEIKYAEKKAKPHSCTKLLSTPDKLQRKADANANMRRSIKSYQNKAVPAPVHSHEHTHVPMHLKHLSFSSLAGALTSRRIFDGIVSSGDGCGWCSAVAFFVVKIEDVSVWEGSDQSMTRLFAEL